MKIFITGGTGFVGSHLTHKLVYNGHEVTVGSIKPENPVLELPESGTVQSKVVFRKHLGNKHQGDNN